MSHFREFVTLSEEEYYDLLDEIHKLSDQIRKVHDLATGWKSLNGAHVSYGDSILRILED